MKGKGLFRDGTGRFAQKVLRAQPMLTQIPPDLITVQNTINRKVRLSPRPGMGGMDGGKLHGLNLPGDGVCRFQKV